MCSTWRMEDLYDEIPVGRMATRILARTPDELRILVRHLQDEPERWFVYSVHMNMAAAHTRASGLRGPRQPKTLLDFKDNLQFKASRHVVRGPVVLARWVPSP